jgi:uncharacterized ubiquitin-like protein YukD
MRYTKRVICGRKVLSAWNESKIDLSVPEDQSATEFYELIFDAEDPYYFDRQMIRNTLYTLIRRAADALTRLAAWIDK